MVTLFFSPAAGLGDGPLYYGGMNVGRLFIDPPLSGPANMARDEALLRACGPNSPITLRFYAWSPATISLGYFQDYGEYEKLEAPAGALACVRRTTGGGAILHDIEITYSLVIPLRHPLVHERPNNLYVLAHQAIIKAIGGELQMARCHQLPPCGESSRRGPFFCFERRHALDVLLPDASSPGGFAKLAGSAQRRTQDAILQHGSIMLDTRFAQQPVATWRQVRAPVDFEAAAGELTPKFEAAFGVGFEPGVWDDESLEAARELEGKYAGGAWTIHRVDPNRFSVTPADAAWPEESQPAQE